MTLRQLLDKNILTKDFSIQEDFGKVDFDLRVNIENGRDIIQPDVYFTLISPNKKFRMNVRTRHKKILEIYPLADSKDKLEFGVPEFECKDDCPPYVSIDLESETAATTHLYFVPKTLNRTIFRKDRTGKIRRYHYTFEKDERTEEENVIFEKYKPYCAYYYYDNDKLTACLLSYNFMCKNYDKIKKLSKSKLKY